MKSLQNNKKILSPFRFFLKWGIFISSILTNVKKNDIYKTIEWINSISSKNSRQVLPQKSKKLREKWNYDRRMDMRYAKKEGQKAEKIKIARKMLERNKTIEEIMEITELTREEIEKLK